MKKSILTLILALLVSTGFSQNFKYEYHGRLNPSVKKEKLSGAIFLSDLVPGLWQSLVLPYSDRLDLDRRSGVSYAQKPDYTHKLSNTQGYYIYPGEYNYSNNVEYVSVEISAPINGKILTAKGTNDQLTAQQKSILGAAGQDTDLRIRIRFKYKKQEGDTPGSGDKIIEGSLTVTVVPETEAEYPGGFKQLSAYLNERVLDKLSPEAVSKMQQAVVKFTVSEEGQIMDVKIASTSYIPRIDSLLLEAIQKMPRWKPAENSKGIKVKQELSIPFDGGGGC